MYLNAEAERAARLQTDEKAAIQDGIRYLDEQEAIAQRTISESDARNAKWVAEQNAKREAEYEKMYLDAEAERAARLEADEKAAIQDGIRYLDEQEAIAQRTISESNARNAEWVAEQNAKREAEYEKMYLQAEKERALANGAKELEGGNIDVMQDEVYPGYTRQLQEGQNGIIFVPRATKLSDGVQKVTDYVSEQWGKFRGLFGKKKMPSDKFFDEGANNGVEILDISKQIADNEKTISDAKNEIWKAEQHFIKEQEYEKIWQEGLAAKELREQALKNAKQIENAKTDYAKQADSLVKEPNTQAEHDRIQQKYDQIAEGIAAKEKVEQQLHDNSNTVSIQEFIDRSVPRKHSKRYHERTQQKYDKIAGIAAKENVEQQLHDNSNTVPIQEFIDSSVPRKHNERYHKKLQKEYEKVWQEGANAQEAGAERAARLEAEEKAAIQGGIRYLDEQEAIAQRTISESNARNAKWVAEQNAKREAEYEQMYLNAEKEYTLGLIDKEDAAAQRAIADSDARNAKWVAEQKAKQEAEYEQMYLNAEAERTARLEAERNEKLAQEAAKKEVQVSVDEAPKPEFKPQGGKNELPETFNQEQVAWLKAHRFLRDKEVLEYPKLFSTTHGKIEVPIDILTENQIKFFISQGFVNNGESLVLDVSKSLPKNEKALKKLMQKLDAEHKLRRMDDVNRRVGIGNDTVLYNSAAVPEDTKYNYRKYKSMELERIDDADWQPEMTREEFMQNRDKYIMEEFERTRMHHSSNTQKKESLLGKLKRKIGL